MAKALYISYFGLREPLVQTQVLPYLREVVKGGDEVHLLTFEPQSSTMWSDDAAEAARGALSAEGVKWNFLRYHKRFSVVATLFDVAVGAMFIRNYVRRHGIQILHARSHVPAFMAAIATRSSTRPPKILFDIRGFLPEEYVDAGIWKEGGLVYRSVKRAEAWLFKISDAFVVLTERARDILFPEAGPSGRDSKGRPVAVIPCCVDASRFSLPSKEVRDEARSMIRAGDKTVAAYVGSFGGWYPTEDTIGFFSVLRQTVPESFALILTRSPKEAIEASLKRAGYADGDFFVGSVEPESVAGILAAADFAVSFIKRCYSKQASSPTKNAECLALGLPLIVNDGIGDVTAHIEADSVGIVVSDLSCESFRSAVERMSEMLESRAEVAERCRRSAVERYSLEEVGGKAYRQIYRRVLEEGL